MSNRSERRAAERAAAKAARAAAAVHTSTASTTTNTTPDLSQIFNAAFQQLRADEDFINQLRAQRGQPPLPSFDQDVEEGIEEGAGPALNKTSQPPNTPPPSSNVNHFTGRHPFADLPEPLRNQILSSEDVRNFGLLGLNALPAGESRTEYNDLIHQVYDEFKPETGTEYRLANAIIQHTWFAQRAIRLQERLVLSEHCDPKRLALFMRYQANNERSYFRALKELQRFQKEKRKQQNGFESQTRTQEAHDARVRLAHAKASNLEIDAACRKVMEAPLPGNIKISFEQLAHACSIAIAALVATERQKAEAQASQSQPEPEQTDHASA